MNQILQSKTDKENKSLDFNTQYKNDKTHKIYEFQFVFFSTIALQTINEKLSSIYVIF